MRWEPTVGTLSAEDLTQAWRDYFDDPRDTDGPNQINEHIAALTAQLDHARDIAAALENELAQRGAGTWPMRQYATVELPPVAPPNDVDQYAIDGLTTEEAEAFTKAIEGDQ